MDGGQLTRWQGLMLQGVLPILIFGIVLPIGLVALLLWIDGAPVSDAVNRGELFLAGGNAAFTGCLVLIVARPDKAIAAAISCFFVSAAVVLPCYMAWAHISTAQARHAEYSVDQAIQGGLVATAAGVLLAAAFVGYAFFAPAPSDDSSYAK
jgi:hypothetical protein